MAVVESLAARRPVLITNQVNIWHEIEEDEVGLVDDDTADGIERLFRRWLVMTKGEREAMAARTFACFQRRYSLKDGALAIHNSFTSA